MRKRKTRRSCDRRVQLSSGASVEKIVVQNFVDGAVCFMIFIYQIRKSLFTGSFQILGTLKLCEIGMLLGIVNGIQFELFGMLFSWHNEYLILVLYNIFRGISHLVLHYLYASTRLLSQKGEAQASSFSVVEIYI